MAQSNAFQALASLAALSRKSAKGLPAQVKEAPRWSGVGFSCLGHKFVAPMGQVTELMDVPPSTRLPGVQPWVLGLANVRGRLLPLFDLAQFFGGRIGSQKKHRRVLVLETEDLYSGIVIDMSFGMQHFTAESYGPLEDKLPDNVMSYVEGKYKNVAGDDWAVFSLEKLAQEPRFIDAALSH